MQDTSQFVAVDRTDYGTQQGKRLTPAMGEPAASPLIDVVSERGRTVAVRESETWKWAE